jgi:Bacterial regulatory helix-turn-helix protein, lysR family
MRLDRFDLNLLVALDALLQERNVTKASKRIHIGQSATSAALARLREYFQDELLVPSWSLGIKYGYSRRIYCLKCYDIYSV